MQNFSALGEKVLKSDSLCVGSQIGQQKRERKDLMCFKNLELAKIFLKSKVLQYWFTNRFWIPLINVDILRMNQTKLNVLAWHA